MSYQALARKWRPRVFEDVVGQAHVVTALANALESQRLHHAFLFSGTRGVGKTTIARILAKCLNCERGVTAHPCGECAACREIDEGRFVDLIEVDAASKTKVEDTRDLLENVPYAPTRGRYKVYLIDEVHMLSAHSFNALLKTLEEPPPHVKFLLATTDPQRLPATVLSRCLQFSLKRLGAGRIAAHLGRVAAAEGVSAEPAALEALGAAADGSVRDGLSLLDQAIAFGGGVLREDAVREMLGTLDRGALLALAEALAAGDPGEVLRRAGDLAEGAPDLEEVLVRLAALLHQVALTQLLGEAPPGGEDPARVAALAGALAPGDVQLWYQFALLGRRDLPLAPDPKTALEMTVLRMLAFRPAGSPQAARAPLPPPGGDAPLDWPATVAALPLQGMARELAMNSVLLGWEADRLRLRVDAAHAQMRGAAREGQLERALSVHLGRAVRLSIEVGPLDGAESPTQRVRRELAERRGVAARALDQDPTVQHLRAVFSAAVVEESVRAGGENDVET
jgi:DNA polymerase-3 subunit gamma/tau